MGTMLTSGTVTHSLPVLPTVTVFGEFFRNFDTMSR